ncbi:MAG: replication initiator protein A [Verrucomicrobiota bacterium]
MVGSEKAGEKSPSQINLFTGEIEAFRRGKDELNLAEFPISVVAESAQPGKLTLRFSDSIRDQASGEMVDRSVTVHGTEEWGLPAAQDDEVMIGLLQLCYMNNWPKQFQFTRYQLCKLLRWSMGGASYRRLYQALHRLSTTNYNYRYAWRDKTNQEWIPSHVFSYIQGLKIHEAERPTDSGLCEVTWSDDFFKSLEAGNLKGLDFGFYVRLKRSISKRLYRFLDKRFGAGRTEVVSDLKTLAFEKIGVARSYRDAAQLKRLLGSAIDELTGLGYLEPCPNRDRFTKVSKGVWRVRFRRLKPAAAGTRNSQVKPNSPIEQKLIELGVIPSEAAKFVRDHEPDYLEQKIDEFAFREPARNPGGFLAESIRKDLPPPTGYLKPAKRAALADEEAEKRQKATKARAARNRRRERRDAAESARLEKAEIKLASLPASERRRLEREARLNFPDAGPKVIRSWMLAQLAKSSPRSAG